MSVFLRADRLVVESWLFQMKYKLDSDFTSIGNTTYYPNKTVVICKPDKTHRFLFRLFIVSFMSYPISNSTHSHIFLQRKRYISGIVALKKNLTFDPFASLVLSYLKKHKCLHIRGYGEKSYHNPEHGRVQWSLGSTVLHIVGKGENEFNWYIGFVNRNRVQTDKLMVIFLSYGGWEGMEDEGRTIMSIWHHKFDILTRMLKSLKVKRLVFWHLIFLGFLSLLVSLVFNIA